MTGSREWRIIAANRRAWQEPEQKRCVDRVTSRAACVCLATRDFTASVRTVIATCVEPDDNSSVAHW